MKYGLPNLNRVEWTMGIRIVILKAAERFNVLNLDWFHMSSCSKSISEDQQNERAYGVPSNLEPCSQTEINLVADL